MLGRLPRHLVLCLLICRYRLLVHKTTSPPPRVIYIEVYAELWRMKKTFVMRELPIASQLSTDMRSVCSDVHRFPCSVDQPQAVSVTLQARCVPLVCNAPCHVFYNDALCSVVCILGCPSHHICLNSIKPQAQLKSSPFPRFYSDAGPIASTSRPMSAHL